MLLGLLGLWMLRLGGRVCSVRCSRRFRARPGSRALLRRGSVGCGMLRPRLCRWRRIRIPGGLAGLVVRWGAQFSWLIK